MISILPGAYVRGKRNMFVTLWKLQPKSFTNKKSGLLSFHMVSGRHAPTILKRDVTALVVATLAIDGSGFNSNLYVKWSRNGHISLDMDKIFGGNMSEIDPGPKAVLDVNLAFGVVITVTDARSIWENMTKYERQDVFRTWRIMKTGHATTQVLSLKTSDWD